jgi:hypothetical protein
MSTLQWFKLTVNYNWIHVYCILTTTIFFIGPLLVSCYYNLYTEHTLLPRITVTLFILVCTPVTTILSVLTALTGLSQLHHWRQGTSLRCGNDCSSSHTHDNVIIDELSSFTVAGVRYDAMLDDTVVMEFLDGDIPNHLLKLTNNCYVIQCKNLPNGTVNGRAVRRFSRVCLSEKKFYIHPTKLLVRLSEDSDFKLVNVDSLSQAWTNDNKSYTEIMFIQLHECDDISSTSHRL